MRTAIEKTKLYEFLTTTQEKSLDNGQADEMLSEFLTDCGIEHTIDFDDDDGTIFEIN